MDRRTLVGGIAALGGTIAMSSRAQAQRQGSTALATAPSVRDTIDTGANVAQTDYQVVPERKIPFPKSVSAEAQAALKARSQIPLRVYPDPNDKEVWRKNARLADDWLLSEIKPKISGFRGSVESIVLNGAQCFKVVPEDREPGYVMLDIHGGGFTSGAGELCKAYAVQTAMAFGCTVYSVDYRMPPVHPFPAGLDDCFHAYTGLIALNMPEKIVLRGLSAGANLAAAVILRAQAGHVRKPEVLILETPELDLTESGDSFQTNTFLDVTLQGSLMNSNLLYADGKSLNDPLLSPLFGEIGPDYPPTLLTAGTRDLFLSNSARMHNKIRRSGRYSELIIEEAMPHGSFGDCPEDKALLKDVKDFIYRMLSRNPA